MPLVQGSALWGLHRVFNHPRSREAQPKAAKSSPSPSSSFWKSSGGPAMFLRRLSSAPSASSPKRSTSAPHGIPDIALSPSTDPGGHSCPKPSSSRREDYGGEKSISKSVSVPHTFTLKPNSLQFHEPHGRSLPDASSQMDRSLPCSSPDPLASDTPPKASPAGPLVSPEDSTLSDSPAALDLKSLPPKWPSPRRSGKRQPVSPASGGHPCNAVMRLSSPKLSSLKSNGSQTTPRKRSSSGSSLNSSPAQSPLKSPPPSSRRASTQEEQLPVTPSPPWSELIEARRRLMAVEGRRRALCALEVRIQQVHCVFLQAELRVARQREGLARLVEAAGRAEVQATVHGQRIRKALRRQKPRLLACALCVPWPGKQERRGGQHPRHPRCALFQNRSQVLRACAGGDDVGSRD